MLMSDLDGRFTALVDDREGPMDGILLDNKIIKVAANEAFYVKDRVCWIRVERVLRAITYEALAGLSEGHP